MGALDGKVAIVTGASRGIGRAVARRLAGDGARVVVNYLHSAAEAEALAGEIRGLAVRADIAHTGAVRRLFDTAMDAFGGLDILVNNAGIAILKPLSEATEEEFDRTFAINTRGAFFCLKEAAIRIRDHGRIVNISTGATVSGTAGGSFYCGSKAALEQFTRALAREIGHRGVTVNTVSPGITETGILVQYPHLVEAAPKIAALGRIGRPEDIADVVAFLCSEQARWITGQNIQAGGGASML